MKGSVLRNMYMDSSMRPMNDIDILFRNANFKKVKELFFNMDYQIAHSSAKDVCFIHKHTGILVEMQLSLMDVGYTVWYNYLEIFGNVVRVPMIAQMNT